MRKSSLSKWRNINKQVDRVLLSVLLFLIAFVGSALLDNRMFLDRGIGSVKYHTFEELLEINPDTVAWLSVDGTHIDHPVVQGKDNFEYLDKAFTGGFYAGGSLFMDCHNRKDFSDKYNIIHGHHMIGGAMFGDLDRFLDPDFFRQNNMGTLRTPEYDYDLVILAAGEFDAYDPEIYGASGSIPRDRILTQGRSVRKAELAEAEQVVALSTCSGDMTDNRIVVFCSMINKRDHE
ncbi:MAG: class B sortase [Firmicutes bacterium]|nr:class B sortase [Bacillota bacterium]